MNDLEKYSEDLKKEFLSQYKDLILVCRDEYDASGLKLIRKSVDFLVENSGAEDEKLGMHFTIFALKLAGMTVRELGLDSLGISAVLVKDLVEYKNIPLERVSLKLGSRTGKIIDELQKISNLDTTINSGQAENMRNLILTLASDFRVILIKISERLFLMRQHETLNEKEQIALSCDAKFIYSPLAHRLGLYNIMSEMEDISMSILEREVYQEIDAKLKASTERRERFINEFIAPLYKDLKKERLKVEIKGRPKAISSIWRKMKQQKVDFEEVYDKFAIRIIIDTPLKKEKADCWRVYSIITDHYQPNPERLRDWISVPKSNGYESLHTTVIVPGGEWVEVQIRTIRMNEIAEILYTQILNKNTTHV